MEFFSRCSPSDGSRGSQLYNIDTQPHYAFIVRTFSWSITLRAHQIEMAQRG